MKITDEHSPEEVLLISRANAVIKLFTQMKKKRKDTTSKYFCGGSRAIGYACDDSDIDVFFWFCEDEFEEEFTQVLVNQGFTSVDRDITDRHNSCSVYRGCDVDICLVNEIEDFDEMKKITSILKKVVSGNKEVSQLCTSMNRTSQHANVLNRLIKAFIAE